MEYRIVADSSSNVFDFEDIDYINVPLKIITKEKEYIDTPDLDVAGMVEDLKHTQGPSSTSCPNAYEWKNAFTGADNVFALTITSNLSGSHSAAVQAKDDLLSENPNANICVIDTLSTGPEMRLIMEKLREYIKSGESFDLIKEKISEYQKHTHLLFSLQSLTNLARNGRVSMAVAKLAGALNIQLVAKASDEGTIEPIHKIHGEKRVLKTLFSEMKQAGFKGGKMRIAHVFNLDYANKLKDMVLEEFPKADILIESCSALCSYYAEKGGLLVGFSDL